MNAARATLAGARRSQLRLVMALFFLALAVPTGVLVFHAYGQLKWEAFHQYRGLAEELSRRVDERFARLLAAEEARSFEDYRFLVTQDSGNVAQRSPLSAFPVRSDIPGFIGWFQVDSAGTLTTPLLPDAPHAVQRIGLSPADAAGRAALENQIQSILGANRLVGGRPVRADGVRDAVTPSDVKESSMRGSVGGSVYGDAAATTPGVEQERDAIAAQQTVHTAIPRPTSPPLAAAEPAPQAAFDELKSMAKKAPQRRQATAGTLARVEELNLSSPYKLPAEAQAPKSTKDAESAMPPPQRDKREASERIAPLTRAVSPESASPALARESPSARSALPDQDLARIRTFDSERDPFDMSLLDSGHFVLYRNVWRDGQRYVQGALIERAPLLSGLVASAFEGTALSRMSNLLVAWQGDVLAEYSGDAYRSLLEDNEDLAGALLYRTRLSAPLADLELVFSVRSLPVGPGATVVAWTAAVLALVLVVGVWLMYRLGVRQIALARQQQDFVSAVSHELRTPITSIRMYAEMLREGWASEEKKRGYYTFIVQESERLSRLIANVLQLARMTRNEFTVQLQDVAVETLLDGVRSQLASQAEHAGFVLSVNLAGSAATARLRVDPDAFSQCVINLVDNALKFSAGAERKEVELGCHLDSDGQVTVTVRDFGPGVARNQMKKIFTLFYRSENELTRETVGTGIGLALVHQLVRAMHGRVDVANANPGARFTLRFPAASP